MNKTQSESNLSVIKHRNAFADSDEEEDDFIDISDLPPGMNWLYATLKSYFSGIPEIRDIYFLEFFEFYARMNVWMKIK